MFAGKSIFIVFNLCFGAWCKLNRFSAILPLNVAINDKDNQNYVIINVRIKVIEPITTPAINPALFVLLVPKLMIYLLSDCAPFKVIETTDEDVTVKLAT